MSNSPLVITGIGGSGTRVFARLAEAAGRHMGDIQNESNDALSLYPFADRWCEPVYRAWQAGNPLPDQALFESELEESVASHRGDAAPDCPWGWKQPRSIHLLPALNAAYRNGLLLLHVMRDGRDVALGEEVHLQLTQSYSIPGTLRGEAASIQLAYLWASANSLAADFGEQVLGRRYLRVTLEDLCVNPEQAADRITEFIGGGIPLQHLQELVQPPDSIGRWRNANPSLVTQIVSATAGALERFGYRA